MPDIISRIKVEAQGADQAAREILKLRDAYREAGEAAKSLSASVGGGAGQDPFTKATAAGGGATLGGGNSPTDVAMREERSRTYRESVRQRESKAEALGASASRNINQGFSVADSLASGRGGSAVGGIASMAGSLLGGPIGIGLAATAAVAMGVQKMADTSFARLQEAWGSGNAQRLGISAQTYDRESLGFSRMGVPIGMVKSFFSAASQSGVDMTQDVKGTQLGINSAMNAMSLLGVSPEAAAGLLGSLSRSGIDPSSVMNNGMFGIAKKSFGIANTSLFTQSLAGLVDSASNRGITVGSEQANASTKNLAALAELGGFSAPGAATFAQQLQTRGQKAASLGSADDIIAFQAMRESGESVTDTMIRMEENPNLVNKKVYDYLKKATGGDKDTLRLRLQSYLGEGTTMSAVSKFMTTQEGLAGLTDKEVSERLGSADTWATPTGENADVTNVFAVKQNEMFKGFSDAMLDLTTGINGIVQSMFGTNRPFDPMRMTAKGYIPDSVALAQGQTPQDVSNLNALIDSADVTIQQAIMRDVLDPKVAVGLSTMQALNTTPALREKVGSLYQMGDSNSDNIWKGYTSKKGVIGGWGTASQDIAGGIFASIKETGLKDASGKVDKEATARLKAMQNEFYTQFGTSRQDITYEKFDLMISTLLQLISTNRFVYTDGDRWTTTPATKLTPGQGL